MGGYLVVGEEGGLAEGLDVLEFLVVLSEFFGDDDLEFDVVAVVLVLCALAVAAYFAAELHLLRFLLVFLSAPRSSSTPKYFEFETDLLRLRRECYFYFFRGFIR